MTRSRSRREAASATLRSAGFFYLRTPLLPFAELTAWRAGAAAGDLVALRAGLRAIVDRPVVREAIFIASPSLAAEIPTWQREPDSERGQRIERGLVRYVARMCGRATPFGEFAGCSVGTVDAATRLALAGQAGYRSHTRLDASYLAALAEDLLRRPEIREAAYYRPNSSLYRIADQFRYSEATPRGDGLRGYGLVAVPATSELVRVIERSAVGARRDELAALLAEDPALSSAEITAYLDELIESQLLVADFPPRVTGPEPLAELIERSAPLPAVSRALREAAARLTEIDERPLGGREPTHAALAEGLAALGPAVDPARLVQVDMIKPAEATLGPDVVAEVARAIALLHRIGPARDDHPLHELALAFTRRYEGRAVPLAEVLDEEWGIAPHNGDPSPLLATLPIGGGWRGDAPPLTPVQRFLARRIAEAAARGEPVIALDEEALAPYATPGAAPLPRTLAAMVTIAAASSEAIARGELAIVVEGVAGGSGASLLGRFCHADPELSRHVAAFTAVEAAADPDTIYAEIVHQPQPRSGNLIARPVLSDHELVYLGTSGAPIARQIAISDLVVAVERGEFVLRSQRLGRRVIPRMSTAHTLTRGLLPYRFLGLLATEARLGLALGALEDLPHIPRIAVGRAVLRLASWRVFHDELAALDRPTRGERFAAVQALRTARRLPRWIAVQDHDNELPVDLDNELAVESFAHLVRRRGAATLTEVFPGEDELCASGPEGRFVHELIVPFHHDPGPRPAVQERPICQVQRWFAPGSPWLYAKLYTGATAADRVLCEVVAPLVERVVGAGACDRWFFLRYRDPDFHVRVRLHGAPGAAGELLAALHEQCEPGIASGLIQRVQLDTYERELERYGGDAGIELVERWFCADSDAVLAIARELDSATELDDRWRIALLGIDRVLDDMGLDLAARHAVIREQRDGLLAEHGGGLLLERRLGDTFRRERGALDALLGDGAGFATARAALARRTQRATGIFAQLRARGVALPELGKSLIHMHANRCLRSSPRSHELVIYDLLDRCYTSRAVRARQARAGGA